MQALEHKFDGVGLLRQVDELLVNRNLLKDQYFAQWMVAQLQGGVAAPISYKP